MNLPLKHVLVWRHTQTSLSVENLVWLLKDAYFVVGLIFWNQVSKDFFFNILTKTRTKCRAAGPYEDTRTGPNQVLRHNNVLRTGPNQVLRPKKGLKTGLNHVLYLEVAKKRYSLL